MTEQRIIAVVRDPMELARALRGRAEELCIPREVLDELAGFARGHTGKMLAMPSIKGIGPTTLFPLAQALGCAVMLIEDESRMARVRKAPKRAVTWRPEQQWRNAKAASIVKEWIKNNARMGGTARHAKLSYKKRCQIARRAARTRWGKPQLGRPTKPRVSEPIIAA